MQETNKTAVFVACGHFYPDAFARVRPQFYMAALVYARKGWRLRNNFEFEYIELDDPCAHGMDPMPELYDYPCTMSEREELCYALLIRGASAVVALCDWDDPEQTGRLALLRALCRQRRCPLRVIRLRSDAP